MSVPKEQEEKIRAFEEIVKTSQRLMVGSVYSKYDSSSVNYEEARKEFIRATRDFLKICAPDPEEAEKPAVQ